MLVRMMVVVAFGMTALLLSTDDARADWLRFRGPNGSGVSSESVPTPVKWSPTENLKWKTALPGAGVSCPIVVGDRVFVTCYSGYGMDRANPGNEQDLKRHLVCLDRTTGKVTWEKKVEAVLPETPYRGPGVPEHGYASHTPVSDGKRVYVFFGKTGVIAFDFDGTELWRTSVGTESDPRQWGSSSSPVVFNNTLFVPASAESEAMVALDVNTGKQIWKQEASGFSGLWGTPILVEVDANRTDLVVAVPNEIWGFNPTTGKLLWYCESVNSDQVNSSAITDKGLIFAIESRGGPGSIAVKAGGSGDISKTHVAWRGNDSNRFGTPLLADGRIYFISSGIANCIDAATGNRVFETRLEGGRARPVEGAPPAGDRGGKAGDRAGKDAGPPGGGRGGFGGPGGFGGRGGGRGGFGGMDYSSPVMADGKIYYTSRRGDTFVLKTGEKLEQLAVNRVTEDAEDFSATPAISHGMLFIRSNKHLYCVGN